MLKPLTQFRPITVLIPDTGIQFLDFGLKSEAVAQLARRFWPEIDPAVTDAAGNPRVRLFVVEEDEERNPFCRTPEHPDGKPVPADDCYGVRAPQALESFDREWLPLPVLRVLSSRKGYDDGPTNWARLRVVSLPEPDEAGNTHRIVLAVDTGILERRPDSPYAAPEPNDVTEDVDFELAADPDANRPFLALDWVQGWLREAYVEGLSRRRGRKMKVEDIRNPVEYWAHFILLLDAVAAACALPRLRLADTVTKALQGPPIDVDLAIDVGNSRTCGILIEQSRLLGAVDINQADRLELRDLTRPEYVYSEPFESRVEFASAAFGRREFSRRAGRRRDAFWWPSPVRIGPEASWLASLSDGTEGMSGLSSPKRYLWDEAPRPQPWTNSRGLVDATQQKPAISGPMIAKLTEEGDLVSPKRPRARVGMVPRYSRSSLYTLMLAELLIHAVAQINAPSVRQRREHSDLPRRLRSFILTLPSATPVAEQKILRRRAEWAVELVWQTMGWSADDPLHPMPKLKLDWDEATCTHLVFLYNEINKKFRSNPADLFALLGRRREDGKGPSLRIASLDIGGGTTDLMIIQHEIEPGQQRTVHPRQLFREGFRQAGDDIVKVVIEDIVLPQLKTRLGEAGVVHPEALAADLFGGDREGIGQQERAMRTLIASQILVPAAIGLLALYEQTDPRRTERPEHLKLSSLLSAQRPPGAAVLAFLTRRLGTAGAPDFDLLGIDLEMDPERIAGVIKGVVGIMIEDLSDVVRAYDCDILLLSGRPSRFPAFRDLVLANLPVAPDRIVPMDGYEVGNWYPFRSPDFRIRDPKTTAVVGALLCQICEGIAPGFVMRASEIRMRSTARFIGVMEIDGQIQERNCLLANADLDTGSNVVEFTVPMEAPVFIGYRQLPFERWKTTPLYYLYFKRPERVPSLMTPLAVTLARADARDESDEAVMEDFRPRQALDREQNDQIGEIGFRLQTMPFEGGYWLDTGILRTTGRY